jgi:NADPH:quinone reductase
MGIEAAGTVDSVGPGVTNIKSGDKISVATGQSIAQYPTYGESAIVPAASAIPYPANLKPEEAASIWVQYLTAYFAFVDVAKLQAGQSALVTAATGGAGLGAIEIVRLLGGISIATTRSESKKQGLLEVGANHVIVTEKEDTVKRVKEITRGKGVDVIFDPIAGDTLPTLAEAVAWGGRIVLYGALGGTQVTYPLWTAFGRNFTLNTYIVYNYAGMPILGLPRDEEAFSRAVESITQNLASGKLKPIIAKTFPLAEVQAAHRYIEGNQQLGKVVMTV